MNWILKIWTKRKHGESAFEVFEGTRKELAEKIAVYFEAAEEVKASSISFSLLQASSKEAKAEPEVSP